MTMNEIKALYQKRAKNYNFTANLYYLIGYREYYYRKKAVEKLNLKKGDTVIELGCGTGINFSLILEKIGKKGRLIGVDLTDAMLRKAKERVQKNDWHNVELVQSDFAKYKFPNQVDGIISTFALALSPAYDSVIKRSYNSLKKGGSFVELGLTLPTRNLSFLNPALLFLIKPFGDPKRYIDIKIWESVDKYFDKMILEKFFLGISYIVRGLKI